MPLMLRLMARLALLPLACQLAVLTAAQSTTALHSSSKPETTATPSSSFASTTPARTSTKTGAATHTVKVGFKTDPHQYIPSVVKADVGDVVLFEFYPRNHSVVQADYLAPCVPGLGSFFYSGIFNSFNENNGALVGDPPTWKLTVNDTEPKFFYCTALESCVGNGMVGAINPNETMTWNAQYSKALKYPYMLVPGEAPPAEGNGGQASPPAPPSPSPPHHSPSSTLSSGAIAGLVVGCVSIVAILGALFFLLGRNRVYRKWLTSEDGSNSTSNEHTRRWAMSTERGWSTNGHSEKDRTLTTAAATTSHAAAAGYTPLASPAVSSSHFSSSGPYSPPPLLHGSQPPTPAPGHTSWDGHAASCRSPRMLLDDRPRELSSSGQLVELEDSSPRHPFKEDGRHSP